MGRNKIGIQKMIKKDIQKKNEKIELVVGFILLYSLGALFGSFDRGFALFSSVTLIIFGLYLYIWEYEVTK